MTTEFDATRLAPGATGLVDRVRALLRMGPAGGRAGASSRLAIDGLPDAWTQLDAGGLYAIYAAGGTPGCDALVWESARQARTRDVTIVLARDPASVAAQMASLGGRLTASVDGGATEPAHRMKLASDEDRVVVSRAVLDGASRVPDGWEIVDDNAAVVAACANAQAATAVLVFRSHAQLEALCADVHTLRRQCGGALKIAVVERGEVLRQQFEMLVLSVGANRVVARDLPVSRMQAAVHALHGQLYARPVAADYRAALAAALGDSVLGYLPVGAFCQRIRAVLDRGAVLALPHTLAKLTLLPGVSHVDALRHCRPRRAGDVVTADAGHLFVFLFACEPVDAEDALARIFDVPVDTLSDRVVCLGQGSIDTELDALKAENRRAPIADYSDLFAAARPPGAARAAATPVAPGAALPDASEVSDAIDAIDTVVALDAIGVPQASAPAADAAAAPDPVIPAVRARGAIRSAMPLRKQEDA
ncbi:cellulose biosynthesis protein BcsE [Burkholderia anthinoferrum]|uniref:cellulose biosynthesis protein BcsE n=1 Tax=Burkholderia anthinoferrum TaxID=3090833 RepID=UPI002B2472C5|nr:cellulose biosynthesis protein BcsE [Burkholderia anthinoferrum]MEB2561768.1 cellulose biosynthesis protein BcsE [Burkholderia anthinoferrum]